ncbi:MAG: acyl-CoA dehydrogenase family protein [Rhodobacteraceae bacterium]|nr:acyl-CoA dehydrogenase family protein [Paracoccaceae bacterium]
MKPFVAPVEDILFSLNEIAGAGRIPDWDADFSAEIARHFAAFAEGEIAPLDEPADAQGCRIENGRVIMPDGLAEVFASYNEQGWSGLTAPEEHGGQGQGAAILAVTSEIFSGASQSLQMVTGLVPGAIRTLENFGTTAQKARLIPPLVSGDCLATMCLSEPAAGSDLSNIRCKAVPAAEGWAITGEKIFISGGDQNLSQKILHLVLARTGDNGLRGLSLFLCRSNREDGSRNGVSVTRIEEKMGLHASPTCQLAFDAADAELIGGEGEGLKAMFTMMNHARLDVSLQGTAHAARAYDIASSYAAERVQGRGPDGAPVTLDKHADIRRMISEIDTLALTSRALAHIILVIMETGENPDLVEFLTPVAKVYCTEAGMKAAELGMQVLGGYGYLTEYRIEQTYRDARISAIYEGANGIHAQALVTRLLGYKGGQFAKAFTGFVETEIATHKSENLAACYALWAAAKSKILAEKDPSEFGYAFMKLTSELMVLLVWARFSASAENHRDPARIKALSAHVERLGVNPATLYASMI